MKKITSSGLGTIMPVTTRFGRILGAFIASAILATNAARADTYVFSTFVGNAVALDHTDGTGNNARFFNPTGVAVDASGTIYVADGGDHTIRRVTAGGVVSTFAGASGQAGSLDGNGSNARFVYPFALAIDATGNVYVTDVGDHTVRKITVAGVVTTIAGSAGVTGVTDGSGTAALFNNPQGVAVDAVGNIYVSDTGNSTIRKIVSGTVTTFAGGATQTGTADGSGSGARFNYPAGLATDIAGNVYVADNGSSTIRKITSGGAVSTYAGSAGFSGTADGVGNAARFNHPVALSLDGAGNVYVIDTSNQAVRKISASTGTVTTLAGSAGVAGKADGTGSAARFFYPFGIAATSAGTIYVADTGNHTLRIVTASGSVTTLAGNIGLIGIADGVGGEALFAYPAGLSVDGSGTVYVADHNNHTVRKVTAGGAVTTFAGAAGVNGSADGQGGAARFNGLTGVAVDTSGNVYVADAGNSTIRKITSGGMVSTFAGQAGVAGSSDGVGSAARFNAPQGLAVDGAGNVYVADTNNSMVRKISANGTVTTIAGVAGQTGNTDGAVAGARFNGPYAVTVDSGGNVYVADFFNSTIRKITPGGTVSTLAGLAGKPGATDGIGAAARFNQTYGLAVDAGGTVYVADTYNRAIRKITAAGSVSTVNGPQSRFYYPQGIALDAAGNIYVADGDNQAIAKGIFVATPPSGTAIGDQTVAVGANATFSLGAAAAQTNYSWQVSTDNGATWVSLNNNATYSGALTTTLTVTNVAANMSGYKYRAQLSNVAGSGTSAAATLTAGAVTPPPSSGTARIINLSVRTQVGTGANSLLVGLGLSGAGSKQMLIRGIGPTLTAFNVPGVLAAPSLTLFNSAGATLDTNTTWGGSTTLSNAFSSVGAFALPAASADTALFKSLTSGTTYTAQISGINNTTGIALAEFYDADGGSPATRLTNVSARASVGTGPNVLIAGFVIGGTGTETLLIRGIGPTLTKFSVPGALNAPRLTLYDSTGAQINANAGWGGATTLSVAFTKVGAFALDLGSADTALLVSLPPGSYSAQLSSADGSTGVGLIEVYEIP
jgi:hypothetical protein